MTAVALMSFAQRKEWRGNSEGNSVTDNEIKKQISMSVTPNRRAFTSVAQSRGDAKLLHPITADFDFRDGQLKGFGILELVGKKFSGAGRDCNASRLA